MKSKKHGITLIALIITIIILLILAGVSINLISGSNGVLTQASKAKIKADLASMKEKTDLEYTNYQMELISSKNTAVPDYNKIILNSDEFKKYSESFTITADGSIYYIGEKGTESEKIAKELSIGRDEFIDNLKLLYDLAVKYNSENSGSESADELFLQFIRKKNYDDSQWSVFAGNINTDFLDYVDTETSGQLTTNYFSSVSVTGHPDIDFDHLCANLDAIIYSSLYGTGYVPFYIVPYLGTFVSDDYTGWAGDLATLMTEIYNYDNRKSVILMKL